MIIQLQVQSNEGIANSREFVFNFLCYLFDLIDHLFGGKFNFEVALLLGLRELAPDFAGLRGLLVDKLVVEIVAVEGIGGEVVLIQQILLHFAEVFREVAAKIVGLEAISLEVDCLVAGSCWLRVVGERIEYFFCRTWLLSYFLLTSLLGDWLRKGVEVKLAEVVALAFRLHWRCEVAELQEGIRLLLLVFALASSLSVLFVGLVQHVLEVAVVHT